MDAGTLVMLKQNAWAIFNYHSEWSRDQVKDVYKSHDATFCDAVKISEVKQLGILIEIEMKTPRNLWNLRV